MTILNLESMYREMMPHFAQVSHNLCRGDAARHYDELVSEAALQFVEAAASYDPSKGGVKERIGWLVYRRLLNHLAKLNRLTTIEHVERMPCEGVDWERIVGELSEDAKAILTLALYPNKQISEQESQQRRYENAPWRQQTARWKRRRKAMIGWLRQEGWSKLRIDAGFAEIREALP